MVTVYYILRSNSFFLGTDRNRNAMFVRTSDKNGFFAFYSEIAGINVGRNINSGKMTDMYGTVCVG